MKPKNTQGAKMFFKYFEYFYKWKDGESGLLPPSSTFYPLQALFKNPPIDKEDSSNFGYMLFLSVYSDVDFSSSEFFEEDKNVHIRKTDKHFLIFAKKGKKVSNLYGYSKKIKDKYPEYFI